MLKRFLNLFVRNRTEDSLEGFSMNTQVHGFQKIRAEQIAPDSIDESHMKPATRAKFNQDWGIPTFVQAYKTTVQSINSSIWTRVTFDGEIIDDYNEFQSNRYVARESGRYTIASGIKWESTADNQRYALAIYVNGKSHAEVFDMAVPAKTFGSGLGQLTSAGSVTAKLGAGDYVEIFAWSSGPARIAQGITNAYVHITKAR